VNPDVDGGVSHDPVIFRPGVANGRK
jgi:hypothetical protein